MLEDFANAVAGLGRALDILDGADALPNLLTLRDLVGIRVANQVSEKIRTCSVVTGFWEVLCSSSIVLGSKRKSFLQPTRMIGRPLQK
jgi:hypothetical protein